MATSAGIDFEPDTITRRYIAFDVFSVPSSDNDEYPITFKCDSRGIVPTIVPVFGHAATTNMTASITTKFYLKFADYQTSHLQLFLTDNGPKIQALFIVDENTIDAILRHLKLSPSSTIIDFGVDFECDFSYETGDIWIFPEFPSSINLKTLRRSGKFEIRNWSLSFEL